MPGRTQLRAQFVSEEMIGGQARSFTARIMLWGYRKRAGIHDGRRVLRAYLVVITVIIDHHAAVPMCVGYEN